MNKEDLKILHITPYYLPYSEFGGPVYSVSNLCDALVAYGVDATIYTTYKQVKDGTHSVLNGEKINMKYFHSYFSSRLFFAPNLLITLLRNIRKFDVVHISMWWNLTSVLSLLIAVLFRRKVILSPRGSLSEYTFAHGKSHIKKWVHRLLNRFVFRNTILHATTDAELIECKKIANWKMEAVIPNLVTIPEIREPSVNKGEGPLRILFLSRIDYKKGLDLLLGALGKVNFDFRLTIAGQGPLPYINLLKHIAEKKNIARKIHWYGFANDLQKPELFAHHDLVVLTSHNENFANVIIESLGSGTAVLVSDKVGLHHFVTNNKLGWVCILNEEDIRQQLDNISASRDQIKRISEQAPGIIANEFNKENIIKRYLDLYVYP